MNNDPDEIHFDCPKCKRPMSGEKALLGETIICPDCGEGFTPTPREPPPENSQRAEASPKAEQQGSRYWVEPAVLAAIGIGIFFVGKFFFGGEVFGGMGFVSLIGVSLFVYAVAKGTWFIVRVKPRLMPWIILAIGVAGFFGFKSWQEGDSGYESYAHKLNRYRTSAENLVRVACTNEVTGLRQFISMDVSPYGQNVKEWKATATVEFINHLGGIDRTNLEFQFDTLGGDFGCYKKEQPWHLPETP